MLLSALGGDWNLCYSVDFGEKNLNLSQANVLSSWIVEQVRRCYNEAYRRIFFQLKLANDGDVFSIQQLFRNVKVNDIETGFNQPSPQCLVAQTPLYDVPQDWTGCAWRRSHNHRAEMKLLWTLSITLIVHQLLPYHQFFSCKSRHNLASSIWPECPSNETFALPENLKDTKKICKWHR